MPFESEEIRYRAVLDTDDYVDGQEEIQGATRETNGEIQEGNETNVRSYRNLDSGLKRLVLAGGGFFILQKVLSKIVKIGKASLEIFSKQETAFLGLNKVAKAYQQDANEAANAARKLSSDGVVPLTSSINTLKNLIATGFSVAEAMQIAEDMKTIGKYNRVVEDLGQAMEDSSKGIKTNSIELIENVGLTERMSVTMEKANVSIKKGINLTDNMAQRQAFLNSIRKQAVKFEEDGAESVETYGESVIKLKTAMKSLGETFGKILSPAAKAVNRTLTAATKATNKFLSGETAKKDIDTRREQLREYKRGLSSIATIQRKLYKEREEGEKKFIQTQKINIELEKKNAEERSGYVEANEQKIWELYQNAIAKEKEDNIRINEERQKQDEIEQQRAQIRLDYNNKRIADLYNSNEEIMKNENVAKETKEKSLESERAMINNAHNAEMAFLEQAHFERESLRETDIKTLEEQEQEKLDIQKKFAAASNAITQKLMKGELKSIDDLKEIVNLQVQAMAQGKVAELSMTAVTEGVLSAAAFASGNAASGAAHASAAGQALGGAAIIGALAGVANRALGGGSGGQTSTDTGNETVSQAENVAATTEPTQTITYEVPEDSVIFEAMLPGLDQAAKDGYDVRIISK